MLSFTPTGRLWLVWVACVGWAGRAGKGPKIENLENPETLLLWPPHRMGWTRGHPEGSSGYSIHPRQCGGHSRSVSEFSRFSIFGPFPALPAHPPQATQTSQSRPVGVKLNTPAGWHSPYTVWMVCDVCGVAWMACGGPQASVPDGRSFLTLGAWSEGMWATPRWRGREGRSTRGNMLKRSLLYLSPLPGSRFRALQSLTRPF